MSDSVQEAAEAAAREQWADVFFARPFAVTVDAAVRVVDAAGRVACRCADSEVAALIADALNARHFAGFTPPGTDSTGEPQGDVAKHIEALDLECHGLSQWFGGLEETIRASDGKGVEIGLMTTGEVRRAIKTMTATMDFLRSLTPPGVVREPDEWRCEFLGQTSGEWKECMRVKPAEYAEAKDEWTAPGYRWSGVWFGTPPVACPIVDLSHTIQFADGMDDDDAPRETPEAPSGNRLSKLRAEGWKVAVHNDYMIDGGFRTFWLLSRGNRECVKGEGRTDDEAMREIIRELDARAALSVPVAAEQEPIWSDGTFVGGSPTPEAPPTAEPSEWARKYMDPALLALSEEPLRDAPTREPEPGSYASFVDAIRGAHLPECNNCHRCLKGVKGDFGMPVAAARMIGCSKCGNKRCPKASDCRLPCTGSNEPGQPGSNYPAVEQPDPENVRTVEQTSAEPSIENYPHDFLASIARGVENCFHCGKHFTDTVHTRQTPAEPRCPAAMGDGIQCVRNAGHEASRYRQERYHLTPPDERGKSLAWDAYPFCPVCGKYDCLCVQTPEASEAE